MTTPRHAKKRTQWLRADALLLYLEVAGLLLLASVALTRSTP